jgi:DNA repair protein RadD
LPMCSCIVDARPTKSEMRHVQTVGRGLRTAPGKDRLVVLDHSGNSLRLGLVTDIHYDRLDDGEPRRGKDERGERAEPLPRLCEECKAVLPAKTTCCPECGHVRVAKSDVVHIDGELVELGSRQSGKRQPADWEKRVFYAELRGYASHKGFKEGRAAHKVHERFGHWPPRDWASQPPISPSVNTRNWILSRQIAFAKGRRAHG